jgi:hypothetical protein
MNACLAPGGAVGTRPAQPRVMAARVIARELPQQGSLCYGERCAVGLNRIQAIHSRRLHQTSSSGLDQLPADAGSSLQRCLVLLVARPAGLESCQVCREAWSTMFVIFRTRGHRNPHDSLWRTGSHLA